MRFEEVINNNYSKLNENDLYILKFICNNKKECSNLSINDLGDKCNVSRTTILRFTQKLGFKGYSEFKVFLRWQEEKNNKIEDDYVNKFYLDLEETKKNLKQKNLWKICKLIYEADRVFVYGTGMTQKAIAKEMQRTFLSSRKYLYVIEGETELQTVLSDITQKDVIIIITLFGHREFLREIINNLNLNGIKYVSMTKFSDNIVARNTNYNLYISTTSINVSKDTTHESTALFFLLVDILFREYINYVKNQAVIMEDNIDEGETTKKE
ncbi:MurR/RpiR family transcriptional regulator [Clostridium uliginosum]|uniref:RpiR family transcriptional regulator, glv operon transcriptional regulator n=1 Tax=Clostridium uliginosum TaxID=119641 RepID=A0A1I1PJH5_9CLOT|nr:MurR/RpiR family transcriptional regulator [Clostridium uliginosum]SFD06160.1 RpiR family transcriptional regulator, glv operon transcriptional regulator [Clostridium uliginosum]